MTHMAEILLRRDPELCAHKPPGKPTRQMSASRGEGERRPAPGGSVAAWVGRMGRLTAFWRSLVGKKVIMAVTGVILFLFVVGHLLGNLQIFAGPERLNAYSASRSRRESLHPEHIVSPKSYLAVFAILLLMTATTTAVAFRQPRALEHRRRPGDRLLQGDARRVDLHAHPLVDPADADRPRRRDLLARDSARAEPSPTSRHGAGCPCTG